MKGGGGVKNVTHETGSKQPVSQWPGGEDAGRKTDYENVDRKCSAEGEPESEDVKEAKWFMLGRNRIILHRANGIPPTFSSCRLSRARR